MIENLFKRTIVANDLSRTLLQHLQDNGIDWMHACGGKGRCTTCKVIVTHGLGNFHNPTAAEDRYFQDGALNSNERLACQSKISGDVSILAPEEYHLPHIAYSRDR